MFQFGKREAAPVLPEHPVENPSTEPAHEHPPEHPPVPHHPPVEPPAEKPPVDLPSIDNWAASVVIPFLDLMDVADVSARRAALLAMEKGKNEENIASILYMADAYLSLVRAYYQEVSPGDAAAQGSVTLYLNKAQAMKAWLGI